MTDNSTDNIENNYHKSEETPRPSQNEHIITSEPALEKEDSTHSKNSHKLTSQNNFEDQQQNQNEVFTENFQKDQAQNKNKFNDYYRMLNPKINSTAYHSTLKLVLDISSNAIRAVKYVKKSNVKDLEKFREILSKLLLLKNNPHVVSVVKVLEDKNNIYIVMTYCGGGDLFSRFFGDDLNGFQNDENSSNDKEQDDSTNFHQNPMNTQTFTHSENTISILMKQIFKAINYLHEHNLAHRDIKPSNFLFSNKSENAPLKLTQFQLLSDCTNMKSNPKQKMKTKVGSPYYVAPEILQSNYTEKCDIWSTGVIMCASELSIVLVFLGSQSVIELYTYFKRHTHTHTHTNRQKINFPPTDKHIKMPFS